MSIKFDDVMIMIMSRCAVLCLIRGSGGACGAAGRVHVCTYVWEMDLGIGYGIVISLNG